MGSRLRGNNISQTHTIIPCEVEESLNTCIQQDFSTPRCCGRKTNSPRRIQRTRRNSIMPTNKLNCTICTTIPARGRLLAFDNSSQPLRHKVKYMDSRIRGNDEFPLAITAPKQMLEEGIKAKHVLCFAPDFQLW